MPAPDTRRWHRKPEERPAEIIDAALAVFGARGLAGARLEEIAERAGISKGTIYLYFENKDALFRAVVEQTVGTLEGLARTERGGTAEERLVSLAHDVWAYLRTPAFQAVYRLVQGELYRFPELARFYAERVSGQVTRRIGEILEDGMAAGEFRTVDAPVTARMLMALFLTQAAWCERRTLFPWLAGDSDDQMREQALDFYLRSIRSDGPGTPGEGGA